MAARCAGARVNPPTGAAAPGDDAAGRREMTLRFLAQPTDVNFGGKVHGGTVMKWIDQAGYACAANWSACYCVTVFVGGIRFYRPVLIGQLVEVTARVIHTGHTSMHIAVGVRARDPKGGAWSETTQCTMVFVAADAGGTPMAVRPWVPIAAEDRTLERFAVRQMELRTAMETALTASLAADGAAPGSRRPGIPGAAGKSPGRGPPAGPRG